MPGSFLKLASKLYVLTRVYRRMSDQALATYVDPGMVRTLPGRGPGCFVGLLSTKADRQ